MPKTIRAAARIPRAPPQASGRESSALTLTLLFTGLVVYASLYPFTDWTWPAGQPLLAMLVPPWPHWHVGFDDWSNFAGYMPLGALVYASGLRARRRPWVAGLLACAVPSALSWIMEFLQHFLPGRVPSLMDWTLNSLGAATGAALAVTVHAAGAGLRWGALRERWFAPGSGSLLALLLIWPFPAEAERLLYVITPVLLAQGLMLLRELGTGLRQHPLPALAFLATAALLLLPALLLNVQRYRLPVPAGLTLLRHTAEWYGDDRLDAVPAALVTAINLDELRRIGPRLAPGECIFSIKPSIVTLYTGRPSYVPPPIGSDDTAFEQGLLRCRYAYAMALVSPTYPQPFYPLGRMNGRGYAVSKAEGGDEHHWDTYGMLVELRP